MYSHKNKVRILIFFIISIIYSFLVMNVYAADESLLIIVNETGKVIDYYREYYIVQVEGKITLENKYDDPLNDIFMKFDIDSLSIIEKGDTDYIKDGFIEIKEMKKGELIIIEYEIRGITPVNPSKDNKSIMHSALGDFNTLYPLLVSEVEKVNFEGGTNKTRVVAVRIVNPAPFGYNVTDFKLIKTGDQNPNIELDKWIIGNNGSVIVPARGNWIEDIRDTNALDNEVYWISYDTDIVLTERILGGHQIHFFTEEDIFSAQNDSLIEEDLKEMKDYIEHLILIKKSISNRVAIPKEKMIVKLQINNLAPISRNIVVKDTIPNGFKIIKSNADISSNNTLQWNSVIGKDTTDIIEYELEYVDQETLGLDYFEPAELKYGNDTIDSNRVTFVRQYIPDKKIFLQKKVKYSVNDELIVTLSVQNVGDSDLKDVYIKEFLSDVDVFREISVNPEKKGVWLIDAIKRGESWQVSYVTNENKALTTLPEIYGVDNKVVLKTLVFENVITNSWTDPIIDNIEKIGIVALVIFPLLVIFMLNFSKIKSKFFNK